MESANDFCFIYSTFPDADAAKKVASALVDAELAACVNIYPPMTSIYRWEGKLEVSTEVAAFIKTRRSLAQEAVAMARPLHPYSLPCFMILPIIGGNEDYLSWAWKQTKSQQ